MKKLLYASLALASLACANQDPNQLETHSELGYIQTDGNTKTETFNVDAKAKKAFDAHQFNLAIDAQYGKNESLETKNRFGTELTYGYGFTQSFSLSYLVGYKRDKFTNFDNQIYTGPSAIYQAIATDAHTLSAELGVLYARDNLRDSPITNEYAAYRAKGLYDWTIYENLKFNQELTYRGDFEESENYFVTSKSALVNKISDLFSASLSYKVDYVNMPGDKEYSDTTFTANIIIDY